MIQEKIWNSSEMITIEENRNTRRKTGPSAILFAINPTQTVLGTNPGLRFEKPATNHLSCDMAMILPSNTIKEMNSTCTVLY
jgi:hypothetical protein